MAKDFDSAATSEPTARPRWWFRVVFDAVWAAIFVALALISTWPLPSSYTVGEKEHRFAETHLAKGVDGFNTVVAFNMWTMWWNVESANNGFRDYWDSPIFHPERGTFAYSEPQPTMLPAAWFTKTPDSMVLAYNIYLWIALYLNGWCAYRLLMFAGLPRFAAGVGGILVLLLPYAHWQISVLQLVPMAGILWTLHAVLAFSRKPTWLSGAAMGFAFALSYLLCANHGLFFSTLLLLSAPLLIIPRLGRWSNWEKLFLGAIAAAVPLLPVVYSQLLFLKKDFKRTERNIASLSAEPEDYLQRCWRDDRPDTLVRWADDLSSFVHDETSLPDPYGLRIYQHRWKGWWMSPGYFVTAFAILGVIIGYCTRGLRWWTTFLLLFGGWGFVLSLGPNLGDGSPYMWLVRNHPGYSQIRNVFRFALFAQLAAALLAAQGLVVLWRFPMALLRRENQKPGLIARVSVGVISAVVPLLAAVEMFPRWYTWEGKRQGDPGILSVFFSERDRTAQVPWRASGAAEKRLHPVPRLADAEWVRRLSEIRKNNAAAGKETIIACLPVSRGGGATKWEITTFWMTAQMYHKCKMVNGYSGFFPQSNSKLRHLMATDPKKAIDLLQEWNVSFLVASTNRNLVPAQLGDPYFYDPRTSVLVHDKVSNVLIFAIKPREATNP